MHGSGIVGQKQPAGLQFIDQLIQRCLPDPIDAIIADRSDDLFAYCSVVLRPEQNPLRR